MPDKSSDTNEPDAESEAKRTAAETARIEHDDIVTVEGSKVVYNGNTLVVDPGDARPVRVTL